MTSFYSNGKLLLTGEYVVLDGAIALALPTTYGQSLNIECINDSKLTWKSLDEQNNVWFEDSFSFDTIFADYTNSHNGISNKLVQILSAAKQLNPEFLNDRKGYKVTTKLDFPKNWGLGSSSTLINNIANWANINPYELLELTFGGSGYDIACAQYDNAVTYQLNSNEILNNKRIVNEVLFNPEFKNHLYFVHLNKKQDSREGIALYKKNTSNLEKEIKEISTITQDMITCVSLDKFEYLISRHEDIISKIIGIEPIKNRLFNDFNGSIKSLGAWGGDFILVSSKTDPTLYFRDKGYTTLIRYSEMIL